MGTPNSDLDFRLIVESAPALIHTGRPDGHLDYFNGTWLTYVGRSQEDLQGWRWTTSIHPDDLDAMLRAWRASLATGEPFLHEARVRRADGAFRWMLHHKIALRDERGNVAKWYGSSIDIEDRRRSEDALAQDIADRKCAEEALRRSEAWLSEAQRLSHTGSWVLDLESRELKHWSPELLRICGFDPDEGIPSTNAVRERIHSEDRAKPVEESETAIRERTSVAGEQRLVLPDGSVRHIQTVVSPVFDAAGRPIEIIGTAMDVTERKRAEEAQRESEERYSALIEVSPQIVWTMSADGLTMHTNQWWYEYTGLTRPETEGLDSIHPEHRRQLWKSWRQAVASGGEWTAEAPFRRAADGQYRWHLLRGRPIRDAEGRIVRWMGIGIDIQDRREAEEALRRTEAWLSEAQRLSHTGSFAQSLATGELVYVSPELLRIYGFDPAGGVPSRTAVLSRFHPEDRLPVAEAFENAARQKTGHSAEWRLVLPDGSMRHIRSRVDAILDTAGRATELIGTTMDVTEQKRAEKAVQESEQRYRNIFEKVGVAIVEQDFSKVMARIGELKARGVHDFRSYLIEHPELARETLSLVRVTDANEAAVALLGAASKQEFLSALPRLTTREVKVAWAAQLLAVAEGRRSVEEISLTTLQGDTVHALVALVLPSEPSGFESVLVTIVDLSERKRAEEALSQSQDALAHVTRVTTLGELTASIAHEVNQPLAAIANNAVAGLSLISHEPVDVEELRAALADITSDAERASAVIERVRAMAKRSPSAPAPLRLADVVGDVVALASAEAARRRVTVRSETLEDLPLVSGDRVQLQQVLLNLVVNAMDAMALVPESERLLEIGARRDIRDGRPAVAVSVRDHGVGLKDADLEQLFEAFYSTKPQGMGMGLAISRSIIEAHGGRLSAEANSGPGATFSFALPALD